MELNKHLKKRVLVYSGSKTVAEGKLVEAKDGYIIIETPAGTIHLKINPLHSSFITAPFDIFLNLWEE